MIVFFDSQSLGTLWSQLKITLLLFLLLVFHYLIVPRTWLKIEVPSQVLESLLPQHSPVTDCNTVVQSVFVVDTFISGPYGAKCGNNVARLFRRFSTFGRTQWTR